jgi:hypothetical protein
MSSLNFTRCEALMDDLLSESKQGWRIVEGRKVRTRLDPVLLLQHFRKVGAGWKSLGGKLSVNRETLLPVLWLALRERGWIISRQDAADAWDLASITPMPSGECNINGRF